MSRLQYQIHTEPVSLNPETVTESRWHQPYSEPRRDRVVKAFAIALAASGAFFNPLPLPDPEPTTESRWHQPYSEPVRFKQGLAAWQQQSLAAPVFVPPPEVTSVDKWLYQLSDPVRQKPGFPARLQQPQPIFVSAAPFPEAVTYDRWGYALSEPVRVKPGLAAYQQQTLAFVKADPFPEETSTSRWWQPLSVPRRNPVLLQQGGSFFVSLVAVPEDITPDKWHLPLADPTRRRGLPASEQQYLSLGPHPVTASIDRWVAALSQPLYRKAVFNAIQPAFVPVVSTEIVTLDKWYRNLDNPTRLRSYGATLALDSFYTSYIAPAPYVDPPMASWTYSWSTPVRVRTGLMTAAQSEAVEPIIPQPNPPAPTGVYTVSGLYVIDQFTDNTVVYDYSGGVSHRTN